MGTTVDNKVAVFLASSHVFVKHIPLRAPASKREVWGGRGSRGGRDAVGGDGDLGPGAHLGPRAYAIARSPAIAWSPFRILMLLDKNAEFW